MKTGTQPPLLLKISNKIQVHEHLLSAHGGSEGKAFACNEGSIPGQEDPLVKEVATHSGTLAWKILWTEKPGPLGHKTIVHWVAKSQTRLRDFTFTFHDSERCTAAGKESLTYCVTLS